MNVLRNVLLALLFSSTAAMAAPASDGAVKQLMAVTHAQKLLDGMQAQFGTLVNNAIQQALNGKVPTARQQQAIDNMKSRTLSLMHDELAWEKFEPMCVRLYKETFTEEEVRGMLSFYKTPAGQAVINKMPLLVQKTMVDVQGLLAGTAPKLQKIQEDFMSEMKVADE
ncbi:MAG: DUF2059 domain-containing protein [Burkholderiaceae bacterium]|nr:DUF2059 domain-containing protein [Roseateles sp.]MBV8468871.1 DUF2059 domain-containing protein [Burkholderiaceae bacterium]